MLLMMAVYLQMGAWTIGVMSSVVADNADRFHQPWNGGFNALVLMCALSCFISRVSPSARGCWQIIHQSTSNYGIAASPLD